MSEEVKLAISYCRKSTRVRGKSIEESVGYQQQTIRQYATRNGVQIVKEFSDVGVSGKDNERPELKEMILYLKTTTKEINELIMYSIDRFGRDLQHNIQQIHEILELVEKVSFVSQPITSDTTYFKLQLLHRMQKVLHRKSFDGNYCPLGLTKEQDSKKLIVAKPSKVINPAKNQEIIQIQYIFYLYMYNFSLRKIASILNDKFGKTKRGVDWTYKSIKYILQNPVYLGRLRGVLEGSLHYVVEDTNVESIIDPSTFMMVQTKLQYERVGRKKRNTLRNPFFNLCYRCGKYLVDENGVLSFENCGYG
ncbi:recombinase family protein [Cytobacillus oceanisediminis]|uniref:recombinase family protein n=1 Tax=Cytobacillus oceanisediminis TaxID=665099 RepID=UPI0037368A9F